MNIKTGTVEGTGAAITINCGFVPLYIRIINIDGDATFEWVSGMPTVEAFKDLPTGVMAQMASGGITVNDYDDTSMGFSIGADTDVNVNGETLFYMALG